MLRIEGALNCSVEMTYADLSSFEAAERIEDVSTVDPRRNGTAIRISAILDQAEASEDATHLTLHSNDGFSASVPIDAVRDVGLLIYALNAEPLPETAGGPARFLVPNPAQCGTAELDACANVKHVCRVELTVGPGRDTRTQG